MNTLMQYSSSILLCNSFAVCCTLVPYCGNFYLLKDTYFLSFYLLLCNRPIYPLYCWPIFFIYTVMQYPSSMLLCNSHRLYCWPIFFIYNAMQQSSSVVLCNIHSLYYCPIFFCMQLCNMHRLYCYAIFIICTVSSIL